MNVIVLVWNCHWPRDQLTHFCTILLDQCQRYYLVFSYLTYFNVNIISSHKNAFSSDIGWRSLFTRKSKTRVTSYELRVQAYELWVQIYELRVQIHELRVQIHELRVLIHELRVLIHELRVPSHELGD